MQERFKQMLVEPPKNHTDAKIGVCFIPLCLFYHWSPPYQALVHDSYRCVVTGFVDYASATQYPNQLGALGNAYGLGVTTCAHIFASSTSQDISGDNANRSKVNNFLPLQCINSFAWLAFQHKYAASAWAIMEWMGAIDVINELNSNGIHHLENVMTMEVGIHTLFNKLTLWFEATVQHHFTALVWISKLMIY